MNTSVPKGSELQATQLSAALNYAVKYYGLPKNPCLAAGGMGKSKADEMSIWTADQFEHFLSFEKKSRFHCAFNTLFYSGIREGELLALTPADIPADEAVIRINKTFAVIDGSALIMTPKTERSKRNVTIHEELHRELLDYIGSMVIEDDERIFDFTKSGLGVEFKRVTARAGLDPIRIHDLRHSHASMLIEMGIPITEISARLGHESPKVTLSVYSHLMRGKERRVADKLGELLKSRQNQEMAD